MNEVFEFIRVCLGSLFLGNGSHRLNDNNHANDEQRGGLWLWRSKKTEATFVSGRELKRFRGSCHCQSVRFMVSTYIVYI